MVYCRYREKYQSESGFLESRFMIVAPSIPDDQKQVMDADGLEYREIPF